MLARAGEKLLENPQLIADARAELDRRLDGEKYESLIPAGVKPHYYD